MPDATNAESLSRFKIVEKSEGDIDICNVALSLWPMKRMMSTLTIAIRKQ